MQRNTPTPQDADVRLLVATVDALLTDPKLEDAWLTNPGHCVRLARRQTARALLHACIHLLPIEQQHLLAGLDIEPFCNP